MTLIENGAPLITSNPGHICDIIERPCWRTRKKDLQVVCIVPPPVVNFTIIICILRDRLINVYCTLTYSRCDNIQELL